MKYLSSDAVHQIDLACNGLSTIVKGSRQQTKECAKLKIELINRYAKSVDRKPPANGYFVYYTYTNNLGTKKYPSRYYEVDTVYISKERTYKETEKSVIVENPNTGFRKVIDKGKILAYVW